MIMSKIKLFNLLVLICLLCISLSCKKQEQEIAPMAEQQKDSTITLQEAQHWFDQQLATQTTINSRARTTKNSKREVLWKFAQHTRLVNGTFVLRECFEILFVFSFK
jgi:transcriptional regulator GlxA family with amidase domain